VFLADTDEARKINFRIRYQVYCLETGYEDPSDFPDKIESDEFDPISAHFIVRARATGDWIAAMRLVIAPLADLPLNKLTTLDHDQLIHHTRTHSLSQFGRCAEVSRLCVVSQYRRRTHERNVPHQIPWNPDEEIENNASERRKAPWLMLALLHSARIYSEEQDIAFWFFLTTTSLARIIKGLGMKLDQTGPACEHRGARYPYVANMPGNFDQLALKYPDLANTLANEPHFRLFSEIEKHEFNFPVAV